MARARRASSWDNALDHGMLPLGAWEYVFVFVCLWGRGLVMNVITWQRPTTFTRKEPELFPTKPYIFASILIPIVPSRYICFGLPNVFYKCTHCAWGRAIHHSSTTQWWESSWADRLATAPYTWEFVTESQCWWDYPFYKHSLLLGRVREQFANSEQSSSRNTKFWKLILI